MNEFEERRNLLFPRVDEFFSVFVPSGEFDGGDDESWESPPNSISSFCEFFPCSL